MGLASEIVQILLKLLLLITLLPGLEGLAQSYSFKVSYGMIHAGSAELVYDLKQDMLESELNMNSSPWLSNLWLLADSIKSCYNIKTGKLKTHVKAIHEGSYHRNYYVLFTDSNVVQINGKERIVEESGIRDVPSLLYDLSRYQFHNGDTLHFPLWDGRSYGILSLVVEKAEKPSLLRPLAIPGWKLTPLSSTRKSRENRIQLSLLLSSASPHRPLRIEIGTKFGDITMRLDRP